MDIIAIAVIYKIFVDKEKKAIEKGVEVHDKFLSVKENLKYWLWGNICVFNLCLFIVILDFLIGIYDCMDKPLTPGLIQKFILTCYSCRVVFFYVILFLVGLFIKFIKRDLPIYYYSSISLLSIIIGYPCLVIISSFFIPPLFTVKNFFRLPLLHVFYLVICVSILAGGTIDIYRYIKNSKTFSSVHK